MTNIALKRPRFITFTGVDDSTNLSQLQAISSAYPVEWGVLFSPSRQGSLTEKRYPSIAAVQRIAKLSYEDVRLAAHLCGADARQVITEGKSQHDDLLRNNFCRVQINTTSTVDVDQLAAWGKSIHGDVIVQSRDADAFPFTRKVQWLFDASGGTGLSPANWPKADNPFTLTGYAGGLGPDVVEAEVARIGEMSNNFYIDMETKVRDANDNFSLELCLDVCRKVYPS